MSGQGGEQFGRDKMIALFEEVGRICEQRDLYLEIAVYGGSSIMIQPTLFDPSRITEDVDYVPIQGTITNEAIQAIFDEASQSLGFEGGVFRDDVSMVVSDNPGYDFFEQYPKASGHFRVFSCKPDYLLAMKARSMRSGIFNRDSVDFYNLAIDLGIDNKFELDRVLQKYYPNKPLSRINELKIIDIFNYMNHLEDPQRDKSDRAIRFLAR